MPNLKKRVLLNMVHLKKQKSILKKNVCNYNRTLWGSLLKRWRHCLFARIVKILLYSLFSVQKRYSKIQNAFSFLSKPLTMTFCTVFAVTVGPELWTEKFSWKRHKYKLCLDIERRSRIKGNGVKIYKLTPFTLKMCLTN